MQLLPGGAKRFSCEAREKSTSEGVCDPCSEFRVPGLKLQAGTRYWRHETPNRRNRRWAFFNSLLLAILYLLGTSSFAASNPFDDARAAYERGDYVQAIKIFRQLAAQGHQWAQRRVGLMYAEGKGVPQDYQEAVKWYGLAAAQGNTPAQYSLGLAYEKGQGVPQDYQEALKWYRIAAAREDEWAQTRLGSIYTEGKGVPQDYQEAAKWYRLAAAQGYAPAQSSLAVAYEKGHGVPQDYQEAVKWYRLAAAQGNQFAQINLGEMYTNGTGVQQDFVHAHMWFTLAAAGLSGDFADTATNHRDRIASKMTAEEIATAQEMARRCQESKLKNCD
jgi:TPR repeat protein